MELPIVIGIVVAVIVVAVVVLLVVRGKRSRSERSDWLGELSEIRRSSLGDTEEVTGALEAVSVVDDDADDDLDGEDDGEETPPRVITEPTRRFTEAGTEFDEYTFSDLGNLRVESTDPSGLRVMIDEAPKAGTPAPCQFVVGLPRGVLWFRSDPATGPTSCSVRTPAGWVLASGDVAVVAAEDDWTYVLCLGGGATLRFDADGSRAEMVHGQIGRIRVGTAEYDIVDVGAEALESEGVVRRHRRLDGRSPAATPVQGGDDDTS